MTERQLVAADPIEGDRHRTAGMARLETTSGVLWLLLSLAQIFTVWGIVAGFLNFGIGVGRLRTAKAIAAAEPSIPEQFSGVWPLVTVWLVNVAIGHVFGNQILGGIAASLLIGFDCVIRYNVLAKRDLFTRSTDSAAVRPGHAASVAPATAPSDPQRSPTAAIKDLERLAALRRAGNLSEAEYEAMKALALSPLQGA